MQGIIMLQASFFKQTLNFQPCDSLRWIREMKVDCYHAIVRKQLKYLN